MNAKTGTYIALVFIILIAILVLIQSTTISGVEDRERLGAFFFPFWLSILLIILCIVSIIKTKLFDDADEKITIPSLSKVIVTLIITAIFIFMWTTLDSFYLTGFMFIFILLMYYRFSEGMTVKNIVINLTVAFVFMLFVYSIFQMLMQIGL